MMTQATPVNDTGSGDPGLQVAARLSPKDSNRVLCTLNARYGSSKRACLQCFRRRITAIVSRRWARIYLRLCRYPAPVAHGFRRSGGTAPPQKRDVQRACTPPHAHFAILYTDVCSLEGRCAVSGCLARGHACRLRRYFERPIRATPSCSREISANSCHLNLELQRNKIDESARLHSGKPHIWINDVNRHGRGSNPSRTKARLPF
jgi:hypothetical protein